jgi:hypothetical protein
VGQTKEQRRLIRLAASMNKKARRLGAPGLLTAEDLARITLKQSTCKYCRVRLEVGQGSFDHIIAFDRGGANAFHNVTRCCFACQRSKFTKSEAEYAKHRTLTVTCPVDGTVFKPRWAEWINGRARVCSRRCAAKSRWLGAGRAAIPPRDEAAPSAADSGAAVDQGRDQGTREAP